MAVYKRGRVWWMCFVHEGRFVRKTTKTTNKKLADKIFNKVMADVAQGKWFEKLPGEEITFKEMIGKYLAEYSSRSKSASSYRRDSSLAAHLLGVFGDSVITRVTPRDITEYKTKRREEGAAAQTVNLELGLMRHCYNLAIREWEWVRENPTQKVHREKVSNLIERWLTFEEEEKLLSASPKWLQEIFILGIETGLRQSELLDLQWDRVDLRRKTLAVLEQKNRGKDTLPLNERALEILKARSRVRHIKSSLVFYTQNGTPIHARNLLRAFYSAAKKAGVRGIRWHDATRHTFATRLAQAGVDIYTIQKLGRWKSISMVMRYAHHYPESLRPGVEVLDEQRKNYITNLSQLKKEGPECAP
ncbi:MAG TPA: site-specific integrase [Thermodesulfobacteriota bacterium]|nr:site-specific integrase [Thermodesulfobacteriota bacterium]